MRAKVSTRRAIVIGGSLGGLFAAHMLRLAGLHLEAGAGPLRRGQDLYERPEVVLRECGANLSDIPELPELT
jgi:hypothetical protein